FFRNEIGLMTSNDASAELIIEGCEFSENASTGTVAHQMYIGAIKRFEITGSYLHHGATGHLLKTRALENHVAFNRLTDEQGGHASYELEFPWAGVAYVLGNLIEQSETTENPRIISYGAEGYRHRQNELYL